MTTTYTATYNGQTFKRTSKSRTYGYAVIAIRTDLDDKTPFVARWTSRKDLADKAVKEFAGYTVKVLAIVPVNAPEALPAGVTLKNGKLRGPVKALRSMVEAGTAKFTAQGDLIPA